MRGNGVRGGLGVRGSMGGRGSTGSGIRGSSSYSGGVRTGAHGYKVQSKTSSFSDYGSSSFRSSHFGHSPNTQIRPGHPMVVLAAATPILYDNRNYYWSYGLARSETNVSNPTVICEYVFGEDDGELQHVTYSNGTQIKSIFFECSGRVNCCGMYCCHDFGQWWEMLFVLGFIGVIVFIAAYAKRHEKEGPTPVSRKKRKQNKKKKKENSVELEELASTVAKSVPPDRTPTRQLEQIIEE